MTFLQGRANAMKLAAEIEALAEEIADTLISYSKVDGLEDMCGDAMDLNSAAGHLELLLVDMHSEAQRAEVSAELESRESA